MTAREKPFDAPSNLPSGATGAAAPIMADLSAIPLPPEGAPGEAPAAAEAKAPPEEIAALQFLDPLAMATQVVLDHPFAHPETGAPVRHVTIRRLTFGEALALDRAAQAQGRDLKNIDLFSAMTGLPAAVIRGMERGDGARVTDACVPFLPPPETENASS